jgi:zinc transport system ATP-binding protein
VTAQAELRGVGFRHGDVVVLEDVDLRVDRGEFLGVIGPNGSGKTTLVRVMLGLLEPAHGTVRLFGAPPAAFREWRRVGYVPQRAVIDPALPATVTEVVETGLGAALGWFRRPAAEARRRVRAALERVGMERHAATRMNALSIGQQQRVLIARALVPDPELLVLDEPTGGIDPDAQETFYALLRHLNRERGVTLVLVSHDIGAVSREVTTLACLNRRLVFHGRPGDFLTEAGLSALYGPSVRLVHHAHH